MPGWAVRGDALIAFAPGKLALAAPVRAEAANIARFGLHALFFAIARRRVRHQLLHQVARHPGHLIDGALELRLVRLRRLLYTADLAHVLQRRRANFLFGRGWRKIEQRTNVAAHVSIVNTERRELKSGGAASATMPR